MQSQLEAAFLVVLERGSDWLPLLAGGDPDGPDIVVLAQQTGENYQVFVTRVVERLRRLHSQTMRVTRAAFCTSGPSEHGAIEARAAIAWALLACLERDEGELLLAGDESSVPEARLELVALAGALLARLGAGPSITVSFGRLARAHRVRPSGMYPKAVRDPIVDAAEPKAS